MSKSTFWPLFQRSIFISKMAEGLQHDLFSASDIVTLHTNQYLHRKGDAFCGIYCLLQGKLKATGVTLEGAEYSLAHVMPGAVIGEIAYLDGGTRTHDAQAITQSTLAKLNKSALDGICKAYPEFYNAIVQLACLHIRQSFSVVDDFLTLTPEQRLAKKLLTLASYDGEALSATINQQELAAWIGISRQSINKILRKWQKAGWLDISYRQLNVLSPSAMRNLYSPHVE
jgi:CRP-like cAMP-binding protein